MAHQPNILSPIMTIGLVCCFVFKGTHVNTTHFCNPFHVPELPLTCPETMLADGRMHLFPALSASVYRPVDHDWWFFYLQPTSTASCDSFRNSMICFKLISYLFQELPSNSSNTGRSGKKQFQSHCSEAYITTPPSALSPNQESPKPFYPLMNRQCSKSLIVLAAL